MKHFSFMVWPFLFFAVSAASADAAATTAEASASATVTAAVAVAASDAAASDASLQYFQGAGITKMLNKIALQYPFYLSIISNTGTRRYF